jgi:endonuclease/exonuclease/phosphatase family metal-dependent hydrolase
VLSRLPVIERRVLELPKLSRDGATRKAVLSTVEVDGDRVLVTGVHLSHLSHGSPRQVGMLRRELTADLPTALVGDMNCWGPPLLSMLPGWRRAVRGRSWPAWRPHSQIDHVLVKGPLAVLSGEVLPALGSDHLAVRVSLAPDRPAGDAARGRSTTRAKPA